MHPAIRSARERFEALARAGGFDSSPGRMSEARELLVRAHREHAGGLVADAQATMFLVGAIFDAIDELQRRRTVKRRTSQADVARIIIVTRGTLTQLTDADHTSSRASLPDRIAFKASARVSFRIS